MDTEESKGLVSKILKIILPTFSIVPRLLENFKIIVNYLNIIICITKCHLINICYREKNSHVLYLQVKINIKDSWAHASSVKLELLSNRPFHSDMDGEGHTSKQQKAAIIKVRICYPHSFLHHFMITSSQYYKN